MTQPAAPTDHFDVAVIGGGPAGLTAAVALAQAGISTVLIGQRAPADNRTTALLAGSVAALQALGVWEQCEAQSAALSVMRIVDDTGRLVRAPEVRFDASEIGLDAFGYNIENRILVSALETRAAELHPLRRIDENAVRLGIDRESVRISLAGGKNVSSRLVVAADGRRSTCRGAAEIAVDEKSYPQSALTVSFSHSRAHDHTSTEFHTPTGPFTLVPLPGQRSSLVWVLDPATAAAVGSYDDETLAREIERRSQSILGKIRVEGSRNVFPLSILTARSFARNRVALVGEAAHVMPPIGAQGLNLGLRDAATIGEIVVNACRDGDDPGSETVLARYDDERRADVGRRSLAVDLLNRSLLTDFLPVQGARGFGLYLLDRIGPLRRAIMREGVAPASAQPRLMRGEAL